MVIHWWIVAFMHSEFFKDMLILDLFYCVSLFTMLFQHFRMIIFLCICHSLHLIISNFPLLLWSHLPNILSIHHSKKSLSSIIDISFTHLG